MRPAGEDRKALVDAAQILVTKGGGSLRELAERAQVPVSIARRTVDNLCRARVLARGPDRVVAYRNRPVAVYLPAGHAPVAANEALSGLSAVMAAWG